MVTRTGVSGALFPAWWLSEHLHAQPGHPTEDTRLARHLEQWWSRVEATCGPASGIRTLFDVAAMPLAGLLGFRAASVRLGRTHATAVLTGLHGASVGLIVLPWAARPSGAWREAWLTARQARSSWCLVFAPPFLSLVEARGHAARRSLDFEWPALLTEHRAPTLALFAGAGAFAPDGDGRSRLDRLVDAARVAQDRVRDDLRGGVVDALRALGPVVEARDPQARVDHALTLVYRILFLKFAESRGLLPVDVPVYRDGYAMATLARDALAPRPSPGVWEGLAAVSRLARLGCRTRALSVSPFNGRLFAREAAPVLERPTPMRAGPASTRRDQAVRTAILALLTRTGAGGRQPLDFSDLGVEELGAVYERILDLPPSVLSGPTPPESPRRAAGRRTGAGGHSALRKQTGTFYTPRSLAEFVVRRTLDPLVNGRPAEAILALRVVDPAMGSGAFLVAACHYLAEAYERALIDDGTASAIDFDRQERANIRRLIAERCLAGVDINPVAVQLARLSIWLTSLARGKPLGFFDHRLRVGNSLIGASPADLNRVGRRPHAHRHPLPLFALEDLAEATQSVRHPFAVLHERRDDEVGDVRVKERLWAELTGTSSPLGPWRRAADVWCAQWFWPEGTQGVPTPAEVRALIDAVLNGDRTLRPAHVERRLAEAARAAAAHRFFHWPLEFVDVFDRADETAAGFDAVIGNPPWEMVRQDAHGVAPDDAGRQLLRFVRDAGIYTVSGKGHLNLYQPFLERALALCRPDGQVGLVLPWGVAVDDGAAAVRAALLDRTRIRTLVGLENQEGLFPVHRGLRFAAVTAQPGGVTRELVAHFGVRSARALESLDADDSGQAPTTLGLGQVRGVGGPSRRIPFVRDRRELLLADRLAAAWPSFGSAAGWAARFGRELNATEHRGAFGRDGLPVLEGKHIEPFRAHPSRASQHVSRERAEALLRHARFDRPRLAYRDVSGHANRQSLIAAIVPAGVVTTHTLYCLSTAVTPDEMAWLTGVLNSYVLNAIVRMLMGGHLTTSLVEQLPVPRATESPDDRDIARMARALGRRAIPGVEAALQALVATRYGVNREEFATVLEGFPLVTGADRERALAAFDRLQDRESLQSGSTADSP